MNATSFPGGELSRTALTVIVGVGLAVSAGAQDAAPATSHVATQAAEKPNGGPSEGIKVHGDWTIEVHNPDGSLVSRHAFKNALTVNSGGSVLAGLLGRSLSNPLWAILVQGQSGLCTATASGALITSCIIRESAFPATSWSENLAVTVPLSANSFWPVGTLQLSGSAIASADDAIVAVSTHAYFTVNGASGVRDFTNRNLGTPIAVLKDQFVQIKVVFSFS